MQEDSSQALLVENVYERLGSEIVILWNGFSDCQEDVSLPQLVEDNAEFIRSEYLKWLNDLSSRKFVNRSLPEIMEIYPNISGWWASQIFEKSFYKTPEIYDLFRLRALELYLRQISIKSLVLHIPDPRLDAILRQWCRTNGVAYEWACNGSRNKNCIERFMAGIQNILSVPKYLYRFISTNLAFIREQNPDFSKSQQCSQAVTIFSYMDNLDSEAIESGVFRSFYWDGLPDLIIDKKKCLNWGFRYTSSSACPTPESALRLFRNLTDKSDGRCNFFFIEEWLSWKLILSALVKFIFIRSRIPKNRGISELFIFPGSDINFWPILDKSWSRSLRGVGLLDNIITAMMFKESTVEWPEQELAICLAEFQGWERHLISCWKTLGKGRIIGYVHSTVRYFDLRYSNYGEARASSCPKYDLILANGRAAYDSLIDLGHESSQLSRAEALRYLYLLSLRDRTTSGNISVTMNGAIKLTVLTDYDYDVSRQQLKLLGEALCSGKVTRPVVVRIKPHPNLMVDDLACEYLSETDFEILRGSIVDVLKNTDLVFVSNFTSALLEVAYLRIPLIISLSGSQINMCPLRGLEAVPFVKDVSEMAHALNNPQLIPFSDDYFYLNTDLRLWEKLLEN